MPTIAPLWFPENIEYRIFGDSETSRRLGKVLGKLCPPSRLVACSKDLPAAIDGHYVVCDTGWPDLHDQLRGHGVPETRVVEAYGWERFEIILYCTPPRRTATRLHPEPLTPIDAPPVPPAVKLRTAATCRRLPEPDAP